MKRLYENIHIDFMKEFLKKYLNSIIKQDVDLQLQATKHVQYFDKNQLALLCRFFNANKLSEEELTEQLSKIGFFSKINIYEKRAIFMDYSRMALSKAITYNESLINYDLLKKGKISNLKAALSNALKMFKRRIKLRIRSFRSTFIKKFDPENARDPTRPLFLDPLNIESLNIFFTPKSLRSVATENIQEPKNVITEKVRDVLNFQALPATKKVTIYDKIDNPNIILRRKKSLYLEHSKPIDYHSDHKTVFNDVKPLIEDLPNYEFDMECYKDFNLSEFVNKTLFENNAITIAKTSKYASFADLRKNMTGNLFFIRFYLSKSIRNLLMAQDKYLSLTDAGFLAKEFERLLDLPAMEYFYQKYLESSDFKCVAIERNAEVIRIEKLKASGEIKVKKMYDVKMSKKYAKELNIKKAREEKAKLKIEKERIRAEKKQARELKRSEIEARRQRKLKLSDKPADNKILSKTEKERIRAEKKQARELKRSEIEARRQRKLKLSDKPADNKILSKTEKQRVRAEKKQARELKRIEIETKRQLKDKTGARKPKELKMITEEQKAEKERIRDVKREESGLHQEEQKARKVDGAKEHKDANKIETDENLM